MHFVSLITFSRFVIFQYNVIYYKKIIDIYILFIHIKIIVWDYAISKNLLFTIIFLIIKLNNV